MAVWELWFVLLLLLPAYNNIEVTLVKTTGREPYVTPLCTNASPTVNTITLILCKIRTERSRGEECHLAYKYGDMEKFSNNCDSRFTFMKKNQTMFLHLTSLTPVDTGNYSGECSYPGVTNTLHLDITVEVNSSVTVEDEDATSSTKTSVVSAAVGVTVFIIITGVILGFIHRRKHHRRQQEPLSSRPDTEPQDIEPYSTFTRIESAGLYSTVKIHNSNTNNSNMFTRN